MIDLKKHNTEITLSCPTCTNTKLEITQGAGSYVKKVKCPRCSREMTRDQLIQANQSEISDIAHRKAKAVANDIAKQFSKDLKASFKNSKHIRIK